MRCCFFTHLRRNSPGRGSGRRPVRGGRCSNSVGSKEVGYIRFSRLRRKDTSGALVLSASSISTFLVGEWIIWLPEAIIGSPRWGTFDRLSVAHRGCPTGKQEEVLESQYFGPLRRAPDELSHIWSYLRAITHLVLSASNHTFGPICES